MRWTLLLVLCGAASVSADDVYLKGGGKLSGVVLEETATTVTLQTGPGVVGLPRARVERVVRSASALAEYLDRAEAARTAATAADWLALARWAAEHDLATQARDAYARVISLDPANGEAHSALGHVSVDGRWLSGDEAYRAQGYVRFQGQWMTPEERDAQIAERAAEGRLRAQEAESDARVREAEARTRQAAAQADVDRRPAEPRTEGIPLWIGGPGGFPVGPCGGHRCRPTPAAPPPVAPCPPSRTFRSAGSCAPGR